MSFFSMLVQELVREQALEQLAAIARDHYRTLVYENTNFIPYFRTATPIAEISRLNIGSRPASRRNSDRIQDLRAIPWVFSWMQSRHTLPGWYGLGHALETFVQGENGDEALALLQDMYQNWMFFRSMIDSAQMILGKADLQIAARYAELAAHVDGHDTIFTQVRDGWNRAHDGLLSITGQSRLLEKNPALEASIRLRLPYIEPLNLLQIELMKRHRAGETDPRIAEGIQLTINAIATALRNSG